MLNKIGEFIGTNINSGLWEIIDTRTEQRTGESNNFGSNGTWTKVPYQYDVDIFVAKQCLTRTGTVPSRKVTRKFDTDEVYPISIDSINHKIMCRKRDYEYNVRILELQKDIIEHAQ